MITRQMWYTFLDEFVATKALGLRGPKPVNVGMLKVNAVQWNYLLLGLRDGHPDLLQMIKWGPWHGAKQKQVRGGTAKRILFVKIIPDESGHEKAARVFQVVNMFATRSATDANPQIENPICQTIEKDTPLVKKWRFGLTENERGMLFFPGFPARPQLWRQLKKPRSTRELRQTGESIYEWLISSTPGIHDMPEFRRALCEHPAELFDAGRLWNCPVTERRSSDQKRIEFFAESLSGLMLGIAPATATRKLSGWSAPKLWLTDFEGD